MTANYRPTRPDEVADAVAAAYAAGDALEVRGGGSVLDRLPAAPAGAAVLDVSALSGVVDHPAADLTVTVRAGTSLRELAATLAEQGQECPIEAQSGLGSTVGGRVATALAGPRQAGAGRVRDWLLRVAFVTGEGRTAKAGGKTVKDVTGYDLCRLLCGSWGTVAVVTEMTLKLRPIPPHAGWFATGAPLERWRHALWWPAAVIRTPAASYAYLEGHPGDVDAQAAAAGLTRAAAPTLPGDARAAVDPVRVPDVLAALPAEVVWAAEPEIGLVHLAGEPAVLAAAREVIVRHGGRMLVLSVDGLSAFGGQPPGGALAERVADALDPAGTLAPWRWRS